MYASAESGESVVPTLPCLLASTEDDTCKSPSGDSELHRKHRLSIDSDLSTTASDGGSWLSYVSKRERSRQKSARRRLAKHVYEFGCSLPPVAIAKCDDEHAASWIVEFSREPDKNTSYSSEQEKLRRAARTKLRTPRNLVDQCDNGGNSAEHSLSGQFVDPIWWAPRPPSCQRTTSFLGRRRYGVATSEPKAVMEKQDFIAAFTSSS